MSRRASAWLAWSLAALSVAMFVAGIALYVLARAAQEVASSGTVGTVGDLLIFVPFLAFPLMGALIASRHPKNPIGWICLAAGFFWMLIALMEGGGAYWQATAPGSVPYLVAIDALTLWIWIPSVGLLGIYLILLFPDGKLPSRRWRPLAWLSGAVMVLASLAITLAPGPLEGHPGVRNPLGLEGHPWIADAAIVVILLLPLCILASALSLVLRYRRSGGEVRQQIKWIAFAASFVGLVYLSGLVSEIIFAPGSLVGEDAPPLWVEAWRTVLLLSYAGVPVAVGFAVLRYRLYNIDTLINRTLVYGSLTTMLALIYFGGVATTQAIFRALTGQVEQPQLAVVVSTLVIAALFNPLRRRIQGFIDRRFYRRKYDARKTLEAFSAKLREETDLDALNAELVGVVRETMQPAHVSLWLRPDPPPRGTEGPE
jgi:hypothetical protein